MDRRAGRIVAAFAAPESRLALRAASRQLREAVDAECAEQLRVRAPEAAGRAFPLRVLLACARPAVCAVDTRPFVWLQRLLPAGDLPELMPATEEQLGHGPRMDAPRVAAGFEEDWTRTVALMLPALGGEYDPGLSDAVSALLGEVRRAGLDADLAAHLAIALFAQPTGALLSLILAPDDPQARWIREQTGCGEKPPEMWSQLFGFGIGDRSSVDLQYTPQLLDVVSAAPAGPTARMRLMDRVLYAEMCLALATSALSLSWRPMASDSYGHVGVPAEAVRIALDPAMPASDIDDGRAVVACTWAKAVEIQETTGVWSLPGPPQNPDV